MIGIENRDSSFFTIESPDVTLENTDFSKNLISMTITERTASMPQGSLSFYDPNNLLSRILRTGATIKLSWGYKNLNETPDTLLSKKLNLDEISGSLVRRGLQAFCYSPTGEGTADGKNIFNCNFTSYGFRGIDKAKVYSDGNKKTVISQAFDDLGVSSEYRLISFGKGNDSITGDRYVRQDETTFMFLVRLAREWRALFHIGYTQKGEVVGLFIDPHLVGTTQYPQWAMDASGKSNIIGYKGALNNVKSYKWSSSEGESGLGDNIQVDIVDGNIVFRRFVAEEEKVITYRLNQDKIQDVFDEASADGLKAQANLVNELLSKNDFEQIKHFFDPVESSTAPQGYGYRINAQMIGNPLYSPPAEIVINNGFPDMLGGTQGKWYLQSVNHTISRSGYNMDIEVIDVFNLSPVGMPVL